jgi:hypothetical protein
VRVTYYVLESLIMLFKVKELEVGQSAKPAAENLLAAFGESAKAGTRQKKVRHVSLLKSQKLISRDACDDPRTPGVI